jgi:hypothetical protein
MNTDNMDASSRKVRINPMNCSVLAMISYDLLAELAQLIPIAMGCSPGFDSRRGNIFFFSP